MRHFRSDEEPELDASDHPHEVWEAVAEMEEENCRLACEFCGQDGHKFKECPNRLHWNVNKGKYS